MAGGSLPYILNEFIAMSIQLSHELRLKVDRRGVVDRRHFLRGITAAAGGAALGFTDVMAQQADALRQRGKACILLWMQGGPSQLETFDPKPGHANGGETKAIDTTVPGIRIAENLPELARLADRLAIVRSMSTKEGNHQRASYLLHTSYVPNASVQYPALGSAVAHQLAEAASALPSFVRIGQRFLNSSAGGILGSAYDPFLVASAAMPPTNTRPATEVDRYRRRLSLLDRLESKSSAAGLADRIDDHRKLYDQAARMILSPDMRTFDLAQEPDATRDAYGRGEFGNACLLARRLVEAGVTFVEVALGNWDTHQDNFNLTRRLTEQLDRPMATLLGDLEERGLLDNTLVLWMGEFGRTPRINPRGGRDHFPRAFNAALAGAGVRGGQVIGATDAAGEEVTDRPISEKDLFRTIYQALEVDADVSNMSPIGRPVPLVEGGQAVSEVFG